MVNSGIKKMKKNQQKSDGQSGEWKNEGNARKERSIYHRRDNNTLP